MKNQPSYRYALVLWMGLSAFALSASYESLWIKSFGLLAGLGIYAGSLMSVTTLLQSYEHKKKTVRGLLSLYIEVALLFGVAYSCAHVLAPSGAFIQGLHDHCRVSGQCPGGGALEPIVNLVMLFLDALYFSIVTMTTLGDASITVKGWVRFVVASQVSFTFYITVVALAQAFSRESAIQTEKLLKEYIPTVQSAPPQQPHGQLKTAKERLRAAWHALIHGIRV